MHIARTHDIVRNYIMSSSITCATEHIVLCQQFIACVQIAKKLICQCATISDEPVVLLDLLLAVHTISFVHQKLARE